MNQSSPIQRIRMDEMCRTERYYTATLLPAILFHNEFAGLKTFLETLARDQVQAIDSHTGTLVPIYDHHEIDDVEIITELDIVRDVHFYKNWLPGLEEIDIDAGATLRPDVIIIADGLLLVIEAKFFHTTDVQSVSRQMGDQRKVIEHILLAFPGYTFDRYCHMFLSAQQIDPDRLACQACLNWTAIRQLSETVLGEHHYVTRRLDRAIELYHLVTPRGNGTQKNFIGKLSVHDAISTCRTEGDDIVLGYDGGIQKLRKADMNQLKERQFKWDRSTNPIQPKVPQNWIKGTMFLKTIEDYFPDILP